MDDLFEAILGGPQPSQGGGDPLGGLLEAILGGALGQGGAMQGMGGGGGGLQGIPGGQMPQGGGLLDILGMILGGGGASQLGGDPNLMPFTEALSEKLGVSPQMASLLIGAAFSLLTAMMRSESQGGRGLPAEADLDSLLDEEYLASTGVASQVALQTGLDEETAAHHLREAMVLLSGQPPAATAAAPVPQPAKPTELEQLLDTWEID